MIIRLYRKQQFRDMAASAPSYSYQWSFLLQCNDENERMCQIVKFESTIYSWIRTEVKWSVVYGARPSETSLLDKIVVVGMVI